MQLRHLSSPRALLGALLFASTFATFTTQAAEEMLRKPVGKGAYEMAYSPAEQALFVATSQSRKLDKGGVIYRLDPTTLEITHVIHNDLKPFGAAINTKTNTLWFGNTVNGAVTAVDAKTGEVKGRLVLDGRARSESVKPLQPRELAVDEATNTVYIGAVGNESEIWVVDGDTLKKRAGITGLGKYSTGMALDTAAKRLYTTNADGEFITIDTATNQVLSRKKLAGDGKEHFFINLSLDAANHRAFVADSKQPQLRVVDTRTGEVTKVIDAPNALAVLFNPARNEVYLTHREAGSVSVIDAKSYAVTKTLKTPVHPNSLALSPDGKTLFVTVKQASSRQQEATSPDDVIRIAL
ncbi:7-bladed beta-propeller protein YncE [Cronobacter dublinensis]|uniref:7-bladed beta-propeller protein YncE n=1 Tax=Cronobacter dublinensis TaxID=413497 RepID=UPI000CFB95E9|nr:YncE family protein [Cronobacter dublinensis]MDT3604409.1 YncE family protein [Cronobacter dublinensis]